MANIFDNILNKLTSKNTSYGSQYGGASSGNTYNGYGTQKLPQQKGSIMPKIVKDTAKEVTKETNKKSSFQDVYSKTLDKTMSKSSDIASDVISKAGDVVKPLTDNLNMFKDLISAANKSRAKNNPSLIQGALQGTNKILEKVDSLINTKPDAAQQHHLDVSYKALVDKDSVLDKIKVDNDYASKLVTPEGNFVDYTDQINTLNTKIDSTPNPYEKKQYKAQLDLLNEYKKDQDTLYLSSMYDELVDKGASQDQLNEFKSLALKNDFNGIERAMANFGGTVEGFVGNTIKGTEQLYAKANELFGVEYTQSENLNKILDNANEIQQLSMANATSEAERTAYKVYNSMSPFVYALASVNLGSILGGESLLGASANTGNALLLSDVGVLGQVAKNNMDMGYDFDTSFNNALLHAVENHITESIGGEALANIITGQVGVDMVSKTYTYLVKALFNQAIAEGTEEGMEALADPIIDALTLKKGLTVKGYIDQVLSEDTFEAIMLGALGGAIMGGVADVTTIVNFNEQVNEYAKSYKINDIKDYYQTKKAVDELNAIVEKYRGKELNDTDSALVWQSQAVAKAFANNMAEYRASHPNMDAIKPNIQDIDTSNAQEFVQEAAKPTVNKVANEILEEGKVIEEQSKLAIEAAKPILEEKGVNINPVDFVSQSESKQQEMVKISNWAKSLNRKVAFANMSNGVNGIYDPNSNQYIINPNAEQGMLGALIHEFTHGNEKSNYYNGLYILAKESLGEDVFNQQREQIKQGYSDVQTLNDEQAEQEVVANFMQDNLNNEDFVRRLIKYNESLAYRMYEEIKYANTQGGTSLTQAIEQTFMRAFSDIQHELNTHEVNFSIALDSNGNKYAKNPNLILNGKNEAEITNEIENYINDSLNGNEELHLYTDDGDMLIINGKTAWKMKYKGGMSLNDFRVKGEAVSILDDIIEISKKTGEKESYKLRKDDFNKFEYRKAYFEDSNGDLFRMNISIGIDDNGNKTIYNIGNIRQRKNVANSGSSTKSGAQATSNNSITNTDEIVKLSKSTQTDSDGKVLTNAQVNKFRNSKARAEDGTLLRMYHGTINPNFTKFNDGQSKTYDNTINKNGDIFLTSSPNVARSYSGSDNIVDPYKIKTDKSLDLIKKNLKDNGYDLDIISNDEGYFLSGDRNEIAGLLDTEGDMDTYFDILALIDEDSDDNGEMLDTGKWYIGKTSEEAYDSLEPYTVADSGIYEVYVDTQNPLIIDAKGENWNELSFNEDNKQYTTRDITKYAKENGYDGVIFKNIKDSGGKYDEADNELSTIICVFNSNQIKSINNLNPTNNDDIRLSKSNSVILNDNESRDAGPFYDKHIKTKRDINSLKKINNREMLTEDEFYRIYDAHIFNYGRSNDSNKLDDSRLMKEGFTQGEVMPSSYYSDPFDDSGFFSRPEKGKTIILVPRDYVNNQGHIKGGFKPYPFEVLTIERYKQPLYELYKKYFDTTNYDSPIDSNGRELSKEQVSLFSKSAVRDTNNNLMPVYRGDIQEQPNIFEPNPFNKELEGDTMIKGYFTTNPEYAENYGDVKPYYLNITNPLEFDNEERTLLDWSEWFKDRGIRKIKFDGELFNDSSTKGSGKGFANKKFNAYELLDGTEYWEGNGNLSQRIYEAGYDGMHWDYGEDAWIPFNSNQIKSIDNLNPTDNDDIRLSKSRYDASTKTELSSYDAINELARTYGAEINDKVFEDIKEVAKEIDDSGFVLTETQNNLFNDLWNSFEDTEEVDLGYDKKAIKRFMRENQISWSKIKQDFGSNQTLKVFKEEYPFVNVGNKKADSWDKSLLDFKKEFGTILPVDEYKSSVEFFEGIKGLLEADGDKVDLKNSYYNDFASDFNKTINTIMDNNWVENTQEFINSIDPSGELTVENIDDILHNRKISPKALKVMEDTRTEMIDNADRWIKGYGTLKAEYTNFTKDTLNTALYEILIEGDLSSKTYDAIANSISSDFSLEGTNGDIKKEINEFIDEAMQTFSNEVKYEAGDIDKDAVKKSILLNDAYNQEDIEGKFNDIKSKPDYDAISRRIKEDYEAKYIPIVDNLKALNNKVAETKGRKVDSKISDWKTMSQNIFELANGDKDTYDSLMKTIRYGCLDNVGKTRASILNEAQNVVDQVKELGIKEGTPEDKALQYILEGHTEERDNNDKAYRDYTLGMLKAQFNTKASNGKFVWENIVDASKIIKNAYDDIYKAITMTQIEANGDIEGKADYDIAKKKTEVENAYGTLERILNEIKKNGSKESTQAAYEIAKRKYNQLVKEYNTLINKNSDGDLTRRNLTPYRDKYSHHVVKKNLASTIESIKNAELETPTELAGTSDYTRPNTVWSSFSNAQEGGNYVPTALGGFTQYMREAADVVSLNPAIVELRQFNKAIKNNTEGTQLNKLSDYIDRYANILAGKRDNLDRGVANKLGPKAMKTIQALNSYAKAAALVGNIRSGLVQFANIPNGLGILQARGGKGYVTDVAKGMKSYISSINNESAIDQSPFMANRFFDFDTEKSGVGNTVKEITDTILTIGDKIGAETIWWSAYEQGKRLGKENPIQYADEITRSAVAGRSKEDLPLAMQSQVINLFLPFQVENNNLFQTLKQETGKGVRSSIMTYGVTAFIFNSIIKAITGNKDDEVLPEFISPLYNEIKKALTENQDGNTTAKNILWGEIGEMISLTPFGSQLTSLTLGDESETVFGEYNPSMYGMTNIGLSGLGTILTNMFKHENNPAQQIIDVLDGIVGGYVKGGKQITRTLKGLQSMGALPKFNGDNELEMSPINYTKSGKIAYVNDQDNIWNWIRASIFGKSNTKEAQEYYDGFKSLSDKDTRILQTIQSSTGEGKEGEKPKTIFDNFKIVKDLKNEEDKTLREELIEQGNYDEYKKVVRNNYDEYLKEFYNDPNRNPDDEPKSLAQFSNGYGLTSEDFKQDTYGEFYKKYKVDEKTQKVFSEAMDIENSKNALGKTISNSGAVQRRVIYEQAGIYEQVLQFIKDNGLEYSDFGLSKTVVGYDQEDINKVLAKIEGKEYTSSSSSSSGKSSGSSSAKKQKAAIKSYINYIEKTKPSVFDALEKFQLDDYKKKAKQIYNDSLKSIK